MTTKPYGFDCEIELNGSSPIWKHYVGTEAAVRRKCMMVTRARKILWWVRCYGDPAVRNPFS